MIKRLLLIIGIVLVVIYIPWIVAHYVVEAPIEVAIYPFFWLIGLLTSILSGLFLLLIILGISGLINYIINGEWCSITLLSDGYDAIEEYFENLEFGDFERIKNKFY